MWGDNLSVYSTRLAWCILIAGFRVPVQGNEQAGVFFAWIAPALLASSEYTCVASQRIKEAKRLTQSVAKRRSKEILVLPAEEDLGVYLFFLELNPLGIMLLLQSVLKSGGPRRIVMTLLPSWTICLQQHSSSIDTEGRHDGSLEFYGEPVSQACYTATTRRDLSRSSNFCYLGNNGAAHPQDYRIISFPTQIEPFYPPSQSWCTTQLFAGIDLGDVGEEV